jgi:hypothetical protein
VQALQLRTGWRPGYGREPSRHRHRRAGCGAPSPSSVRLSTGEFGNAWELENASVRQAGTTPACRSSIN